MATTLEQQRLRMDLGFGPDDTASLSNEVIDDIFLEAGEFLTDSTSVAVNARVISIRRLLMQAANEVDYSKNRTSEKASQRHAQLEKELARWEAKLEQAITAAGDLGVVRSGKPMQQPARLREYPWGYTW